MVEQRQSVADTLRRVAQVVGVVLLVVLSTLFMVIALVSFPWPPVSKGAKALAQKFSDMARSL